MKHRWTNLYGNRVESILLRTSMVTLLSGGCGKIACERTSVLSTTLEKRWEDEYPNAS